MVSLFIKKYLRIEYYLLKGTLIGLTNPESTLCSKKATKVVLNPLFLGVIFLALLALTINWHFFSAWKKYVELYYQYKPTLVRSGTPILLFLGEIISLHYFVIPVMVLVLSVLQIPLRDINFSSLSTQNNISCIALEFGESLSKALVPYLVYVLLITIFAIIKGIFTMVIFLLITHFIVGWFCFVPPFLILKCPFPKILPKAKIIAVGHILLACFLCIFWVAVSTGGYGLKLITFFHDFFVTPRPQGNLGLYGLYFLCIFHPFYVDRFFKILKGYKFRLKE